jgi:hypothetical protein
VRSPPIRLACSCCSTAAGAGELPATRTVLYERGVQALACETTDSRRVERRRDGPGTPVRVAAARRLATVTLLTGRRRITRRSPQKMPTKVVALDTITDATVSDDALQAVYDSAWHRCTEAKGVLANAQTSKAASTGPRGEP